LEELSAAYQQAGQEVMLSSSSSPSLSEILTRVDFDENGEINYSEFVSGTLDRSLLNPTSLLKVFRYLLDTNTPSSAATASTSSSRTEELTYRSLRTAFMRRGDFDGEHFRRMMESIGVQEGQGPE
jgi:hypothetical protein